MFTGHKKLLSEYTNAGNLEMVRYLLSVPGMCDPKMEDGTNAFVMALSRRDIELIEVLISSEIPSDIDPKWLGKRAVLEMNRSADVKNAKVKEVLSNTLKQLKVSLEEGGPQPQKLISEE